MSKNSDFFAKIREEEYDDYRQDNIYLEEQKWMEEEEYWNSFKRKAIVTGDNNEKQNNKKENEELFSESDTLPFP